MIVTGGLIGLALSGGLLLALAGWRRARRPSLISRVEPHIRDLRGVGSVPSPAISLAGRLQAVAGRIGELVGSEASVRRRLLRLGDGGDVESFRMAQAQWALGGFGAAFAVALLLAGRGAAPVPLLVLCGAGALAGVFGCDQRLSAQVQDRERRMVREFPAAADLLALAVASGESPRAALDRVAQRLRGPLGDEFGRLLADMRAGTPVPAAFVALARRTGIPSLARFCETMAVAVERGTPLVDVLHAQAADVRDAGRRELVESAGRREIAMMLPVVFLVLPLTILIAFYPGWVSLTMTTGHP